MFRIMNSRVLEFTLNRPYQFYGENDSYQGSLWRSRVIPNPSSVFPNNSD